MFSWEVSLPGIVWVVVFWHADAGGALYDLGYSLVVPVLLGSFASDPGPKKLFFRGYLQHSLPARFRGALGVVSCSPPILFGLLHYAPAEMGAGGVASWWVA